VDLRDIISGLRDEVLDQGASLEDGDLRGLRSDTHRHQVSADRAPVALATPAPFERLLIELRAASTEDRLDRTLCTSASTLWALPLGLTLLSRDLALLCSTLTTSATATATATPRTRSTALSLLTGAAGIGRSRRR
jgi:hypothetical protein